MKNTEFAKILLMLKKTPQLRVSLQVAWNTKRYQEDINKKKPFEADLNSKHTSPLGTAGWGDYVLSLWCTTGTGDSHPAIKPHSVCCGGLIFDFKPLVLRNSLKSFCVVLWAFQNRFPISADPEHSFCGGVVSKDTIKVIVHTWNCKTLNSRTNKQLGRVQELREKGSRYRPLKQRLFYILCPQLAPFHLGARSPIDT